MSCDHDDEMCIFISLPQPSLWAVVVGVATAPVLKTYRCPNGHCVQIHNTSAGSNTHGSVYQYDSPEAQCNCNRTGMCCVCVCMCVHVCVCFPLTTPPSIRSTVWSLSPRIWC